MRDTEMVSIGSRDGIPQPMSTNAPNFSRCVTVAGRISPTRRRERYCSQHSSCTARRDRIAKALSDAAGTPLTFEAVLEQNAAEKRMETVRDEAQRTLIEAFGRDLVQIDEGEKP